MKDIGDAVQADGLPEAGDELLPWQQAVIRLNNGENVEWGAWTWRQYRIPDGILSRSDTGFLYMQRSLMAAGEEFSVSVWRPSVGGTPAGYRLVLITWGKFLDMTKDEVYDRMNGDYGAPSPG